MSTISMNCRRAASFAGTQCLSRLRRTHGVFSRLRRSLRKQTEKSLFSAPYGKALQKQSKNLHKGNHRSPTTCEKWKNKITEGPNPGNSPGVGASLLIGKDLRSGRAYGGNHGSKPQLWRVPLHRGSPTEAREKPPKDRNPSFRISCEKEKH